MRRTDRPETDGATSAGTVTGGDDVTAKPSVEISAVDAASGGSPAPDGLPASEPTVETRVGWWGTLAGVCEDRTALAGLSIVAVVTTVAAVAFVDSVVFGLLAEVRFFAGFGVEKYWFAKTVWTSPVAEPAGTSRLLPPVGVENQYGEGTWAHPLGTDHRGRDVLLRIVYGSRIALSVGLSATVIGTVCGTAVGAVGGYYGGWVDDALMRAAETLYAIPFLVLVLAVMAVLGRSLAFAVVGVGVASVPKFARLVRSRVLTVREAGYVEAARAAGVRDRNVIRRHVVPNSLTPVLVQATLQVGATILVVAGLSFLGFGAQPPTPSWGQMLSTSRNYMLSNAWFSVWPGLAILLTVVGFTLLGDGLRDALDPRLTN